MAQKINRILYAGIFISDKELDKIRTFIPEDFTKKENYRQINYPHMTIFRFNNIPIEDMRYVLNNNEQPHMITIDGISKADNIIALRVSECKNSSNIITPSTSKTKHITLALAQDAKEIDSNKITEWESIDPFTFICYLRILYKSPKHNK